MAKKSFEIQGTKLRIGGLDLEAGLTGVVIPGITQATTYFVEEVNETDGPSISPNDPPNEFNNLPVIIDAVTYSDYLNTGTSTGRATYSCELDDNEIDEVDVNTAGIYSASEADRNANADLWAYTGTEVDPFVVFTSSDWIEISFRPKMHVGEVENIGSGSGGLPNYTGEFIGNILTINTTIDNTTPAINGTIIDLIPTTTLNANDWIGSGTNDPGTYAILRLSNGNTYEVTGWNTDSNGNSGFLTIGAAIDLSGDQIWPITITSYNYQEISDGKAIEVGNYTWKFNEQGDMLAPGDIITGIDGQGGRFIQDCADGTTSMRWINVNQGSSSTQLIRAYTGDPDLDNEVERAQIKLDWDETEDKSGLTIRTFDDSDDSTDYDWKFRGDGHLEFPDGSVQITAYTGESGPSTGLGSITVPADTGPYKGLKASYGRIYSNSSSTELNVSKIVIHKPADTTTTIDLFTDNDDFRVAGLTTSDVVAMFVLYGDVNGPKDVTVLQSFTEAVIDTVLLAGGVEGSFNTLADMRTAFNTNIAALSSAADGLYTQFKFYEPFVSATTGVTTVLQGSGAVFEIGDNGLGEYTASGIQSNGINYLPGHKILVLGTDLGGVTPDNDCIITIDSISEGGLIFQWSVVGAAAGTVSTLYAPVTGTNYQVGSGATFQGIGKNDDDTLYANFNSQGNNYVAGDVLTLLGSDLQAGVSPDNDITLTVTSSDAGDGRIYVLDITGTLPEIWPTNFIGDGGRDQYDNGNYISTDLANQINYNGGEIVADGVGEFGAGSAYSFIYQPGIFGLLVTGNSANYVDTSGGSGADGSSTADTGELYIRAIPEQTFDNAINYLNIVSDDPTDGIRFSDGTRLTSAEGVGRVKLISPGDRRIEEVTGFNQVSVTSRITTNLTATASRSAVNESSIWLGSSEPLHDIVVSPQLYGIIDDASMQFSVDNNTWYNFSTISVIDNERVYGISVPVSYNQGDPIYFRYSSGAAPVVWWDKNNLPAGGQNFRGAVIDYHAWTGESTIIGTIHIVDDDGEEYISHQEVQSGSTDGENDDLWLVTQEGQIQYRRIDGESKILKIHWTAKVFYGSELYD